MNYLIVIPARGGSKGIPNKNIISVGGKPLIAYSIEVAREVLGAGVNAEVGADVNAAVGAAVSAGLNAAVSAGLSGEMVVSTDSERIADIAREWGGNVPFLRPDEISGDSAKSVEFLLHAVDYYEKQGRLFDATILLQPTTPLRTAQDVLQAVRLYESVGRSSLFSAFEENHICDLVSYRKRGDIAIPQNPLHNAGVRRQEHEAIYVRNGAVYITDIEFMRREQKVMCDEPALYVMPKNRSVNLDTPEDLELLQWIVAANCCPQTEQTGHKKWKMN